MENLMRFDYYYGIESEQFSFFRVPKLLMKDERFKKLSSDAKLLYGLMLDRMSLSMKNGWFDEENKAYIYYTVDSIMDELGCAKATCVKIMAELDNKKGIGLIEKKKQGLGKPDIIYVKNFATLDDNMGVNEEKNAPNTDKTTEVQNLNFKKFNNQTSGSSDFEPQEVQNLDLQRSNNYTSGSSKSELQEVQMADPNYTNNNYLELSYNNPIYQSPEQETVSSNDGYDKMDSTTVYMELIKENIDYEHHMLYDKWNDKAMYQELFDVICEIVCVSRKTIKIGGEEYPYELVKSKFLKLNSSHLEYILGCMKNTTTKISNIKAYMITALYNAPSTMNHYYQQEVQHDLYGGGWNEKSLI